MSQKMTEVEKQIRFIQIRNDMERQELYMIISSSVEEIEKDKSLQEKSENFQRSMRTLIRIFSENISLPFNLAKSFIPPIKEFLLVKEEKELSSIEIPDVHDSNKIASIRSHLINLHELCKTEPFKSSMCYIQKHFANHWILKLDHLMYYETNKKLSKWQAHLSRAQKTQNNAEINDAQKHVNEYEAKLEKVNKYIKRAEQWCDELIEETAKTKETSSENQKPKRHF